MPFHLAHYGRSNVSVQGQGGGTLQGRERKMEEAGKRELGREIIRMGRVREPKNEK